MAYYMEELGVDLDLVGGDRVAWLARIRQLEDRVQRLETEAGRVGEITSDGVPWFCRSEETGGGGGTQAAGPATALVHSLPLARGLEAAEPTDGGGGVMIVPGSPLPAAGYGRPLVMDRRGAPKPPSPDWTDVAGGMQIPGSAGAPRLCRPDEVDGRGGAQGPGSAAALAHSLPLARDLAAAEPTDGGDYLWGIPGSAAVPLPTAGYSPPPIVDQGAPEPPLLELMARGDGAVPIRGYHVIIGDSHAKSLFGSVRAMNVAVSGNTWARQAPALAAVIQRWEEAAERRGMPTGLAVFWLGQNDVYTRNGQARDAPWATIVTAVREVASRHFVALLGPMPRPQVDAQSAWKRTAAYDLDRRLSSLAGPRVGFFSVGRSLCVMGRRDEEGKRQHWVNEDRGYFSADGVHLTHLGRRRVLSGLPSWLAELRQPSE
ncbi:hypothetical protein FJT64_027822 [Amphibalanus amphitrite]|uniref:Uncharacterized protein n=1 Tax=Amphibalanus amphitrite TaxID=1232801 RepID=A0A6A4VGV7_AMPAM|nr:hypothetical protein FJT64_011058 [Amphibalanus amphitrite]KAF0299416.1 hypothetical protein FJT64_027822 [Amphibalanus amphitrite]